MAIAACKFRGSAILLAVCLAAALGADSRKAPLSHESSEVVVTDAKRTEGKGSVLTCRITNCLEATVTLTLNLTNARSLQPLPDTFVSGDGTRSWELVPIDPDKHWKFEYKMRWRGGGMTAHQDTKFVYRLPYPPSPKREMIQGNFGAHSHGSGTGDEYATDWAMPVGSPVCAARAGIVVAIQQGFDAQGVGPEFGKYSNYMVVRHDDGTFGEYLHLQKNGALVEVGEHVKAGAVIALSGHTGNSTTPHLHFAVFVNKDGSTKTSLPIRWKTRNGVVDSLTRGHWY